MLSLGIQVLGFGVFLFAFFEVFVAVLIPRAGSGPVANGLSAAAGYCIRRLGQSRWRTLRRAMIAVGPALFLAQIATWWALFVLGFGLVAWPGLGTTIQASGSATAEQSFANALYYAGYTFTTLGTGDLVPQSSFQRLMMAVVSAVGFSFFTLVLAYGLSTYDALARRNVFARSLMNRTDGTGDATQYLGRMLQQPCRASVEADLSDIAEHLAYISTTHHLYPILFYFRFPEPCYAVPRLLYVPLMVAELSQHVLDTGPYPWLSDCEPMRRMTMAAHSTVDDMFPARVGWHQEAQQHRPAIDWQRLADRLSQQGLATSVKAGGTASEPGGAASGAEGAANGADWRSELHALSSALGHRWDEIAAPTESSAR